MLPMLRCSPREKVAQAREFRDTMDAFKDVGEELALTIGKELLPSLTGLAKVHHRPQRAAIGPRWPVRQGDRWGVDVHGSGRAGGRRDRQDGLSHPWRH